jgi:predicted nucleic acid-binding protein
VKLVLDASVAVAAVRRNEPDYLAARARVDGILTGRDELIVPALFPIEVAAALARRAVWPHGQIAVYVARLLAPPCRVATIGVKRAHAASQLAAVTRLRAADAVYVWLASQEGVVLVSSDEEVLQRGAAVCHVERP